METEEDAFATLLGDSAARFLDQHHSMARARQVRADRTALDREMWSRMAEQGWLALRLPDACGGAELGVRAAMPLLQAFGNRVAADPLIGCALAPGALLATLPFSPAVAQLGEALAAGTEAMAMAWQGRPGQLEPESPVATGRVEGDAVLLEGRSLYVAPGLDRLLVLVSVAGEPAICDVSTVDVQWRDIALADGGTAGEAVFDGVRARVLHRGPEAQSGAIVAVREATLATAVLLTALAGRALDLTIAHVRQRRQFDRALAEFQSVQHRLVDLRIQCMLASSSCRNALRRLEAAAVSDDTAAAISAAKARASDTALLVTRTAIQFHGAMGYAEEADIGLYLRAALRHAAAFGNAPSHRARHLTLAKVPA